MAKRIRHTVTDSKGQVHTRTSTSRTYKFAVVHHIAGHHYWGDPTKHWCAPYSHAEWSGNRILAERAAAHWRGKQYCEGVEIIEAQVS